MSTDTTNNTTTNTMLDVEIMLDQRAGISQGYSWPEKMRVVLDLTLLTQEEREYFLQHSTWCGGGAAVRWYHQTLQDPSADGLLAHIRRHAAEATAQEDARRNEALRIVNASLQQPVDTWIECKNHYQLPWRVSGPNYEGISSSEFANYPGVRKRLAEAQAEADRRNAEVRATREAAAAAAAQAVASAAAALRTWAMEHGSELLRARIAEGFSWERLARQEFVTAHLPEGFAECGEAAGDAYVCEEPSLTQIEALREAQTMARENSTLYQNPSLIRNGYEDDAQESRPWEVAVTLEIILPDGSTHEVGRVLGPVYAQ